MIHADGLGCPTCFDTCGNGMSGLGDAGPAIYGPVNGKFVTLAEFQQWQASETAKNGAAAGAQLNSFLAANPVFQNTAPAIALQTSYTAQAATPVPVLSIATPPVAAPVYGGGSGNTYPSGGCPSGASWVTDFKECLDNTSAYFRQNINLNSPTPSTSDQQQAITGPVGIYSTTDTSSWFSQAGLFGLPNWILVAGAGLAAFAISKRGA